MKRFYRIVTVTPDSGIALDGRPVRTPGRVPLVAPTAALADAIAAEWDAQGDEIDPRSMRFTGLANAAIDRVAPDAAGFASGLATYGESDLLCYRADHPAALAALQARAWDPLLDWATRRYDVAFAVTAGVVHVAQPTATIERLAAATAAHDAFALAGLSPLVTISGSLVAALAIADRAIDGASIWQAVTVDERWQAEKWGEDALAMAAQEARRVEFLDAARFLALASQAAATG